MLLSAAAGGLAPLVTPLQLDSSGTYRGALGELGSLEFQFDPAESGRVTATLGAAGFPARLALVDQNGQPIVESDSGAVTEYVAGGTAVRLEVTSLGAGGAFSLAVHLSPASLPSEPVPVDPSVYANTVAIADFDGNPDLVAPDGVHRALGDGTFERTALGGPLAAPGESVNAVAIGRFQPGGSPVIAVAEVGPDFTSGDVRVLAFRNGQLQSVAAFPTDDQPDAVLPIMRQDGQLELVVASRTMDTVTVYRVDPAGNVAVAQAIFTVGDPTALAYGRLATGQSALFIAAQSNGQTGEGQGVSVLPEDATGLFDTARTMFVALGDMPSAVVAGDFGNGTLDFAVTGLGTGTVSVYLGDGTGRFPERQSYTVGEMPSALATGDFNGDGAVDLATANFASGGISILLGNGDGTFQPQLRSAADAGPASLAVADLNGDGRADLAVANANVNDVSVLLGNGNGTFRDQITNAVGIFPAAMVAADFNRDGHRDLVTVNQLSNDVSVLVSNGDGTFGASVDLPVGASPVAAVAGDFNDDGRPDLAVVLQANPFTGQSGGLALLFGNGDGTFQAPTDIAVPDGFSPTAIVAGRFAGGPLDLALTDQATNSVLIFQGDGQGGFQVLPPIPLGPGAAYPSAIVAGDFGNGQIDLAVANLASDNVSILLGDGAGGFTVLAPTPLTAPAPLATLQLAAGDFTGDGRTDLGVAGIDGSFSGFVAFLDATGSGTFQAESPVTLNGEIPSSIAAAQLARGSPSALAVSAGSGDGDPAGNEVLLLDRQGTRLAGSPIATGAGGTPISLVAADFTGDGLSDLAVARTGPDNVIMLLNGGDGSLVSPSAAGLAPQNSPLVANLTGAGAPGVAVVDGAGKIVFRPARPGATGAYDAPVIVNPGDPSRDIAAVRTTHGVLLASADAADDFVSLFQYQNGRFTRIGGKLPTGGLPAQIVAADLTGDGENDLVVRNAGDGTLSLFLSDGAGGFRASLRIAVGAGVSDLAVADVNGDGRPDLIVTNQPAGEVALLLNEGGGSFGPPTRYRAGSGLSAFRAGDGTSPDTVIGDDQTVSAAAVPPAPHGPGTIVTANRGTNTIGVLVGLGDGRFANPVALPTQAPVSVVRVADLNNDGIADLALLSPAGVTIELGNGYGGFGPSTTYDAGPAPTGLTIGGEPDSPRLLVGDAHGDLLVLVGDGQGHFAPPSDVAGKVALAVVPSSGPAGPSFVFANQSLSHVVVKSGPQSNAPVAQTLGDLASGLLAPSAVATADLNGDGLPDLVVVNSGANRVLVYPGVPGGGFGPALNEGRGFPTGTDPVAVTVADANGDGRPDLIVADHGSNDVALLLNGAAGGELTFVPGLRLQTGVGPVGAALIPSADGGPPDLVVSDGVSNDLMVLHGRGNGFFDDANPTVVPLGYSPGPIQPGPGDSVVSINPGASTVTLFRDLSSDNPTWTITGSGGLNPVASLAVRNADGSEDLLVANYGSGSIALLTVGAQGLTLTAVEQPPELPHPTDLAFATREGTTLEVYAATAGEDSAALITFLLGGGGLPAEGSGGVPTATGTLVIALQPTSESGLPLVATLLAANTSTAAETELATLSEPAATASAAGPSAGQSLVGNTIFVAAGASEDEDLALGDDATPAPDDEPGAEAWVRSVLGLDEAFEQLRRRIEPEAPGDAAPRAAAPPASSPHPGPVAAPDSGTQTPAALRSRAIDAALATLVPVDDSLPTRSASLPPADEARGGPVLVLPLLGSWAFTTRRSAAITAPPRLGDEPRIRRRRVVSDRP